MLHFLFTILLWSFFADSKLGNSFMYVTISPAKWVPAWLHPSCMIAPIPACFISSTIFFWTRATSWKITRLGQWDQSRHAWPSQLEKTFGLEWGRNWYQPFGGHAFPNKADKAFQQSDGHSNSSGGWRHWCTQNSWEMWWLVPPR